MVIVKKSSPKNLSANCRPSVGRQVFWGALLHNYLLNNAKWFIFYKRFTVETGVRLWSCLENHFDTWSTFHLSGVAKLKELVLASENMMPKSTGFESSLDIAPI